MQFTCLYANFSWKRICKCKQKFEGDISKLLHLLIGHVQKGNASRMYVNLWGFCVKFKYLVIKSFNQFKLFKPSLFALILKIKLLFYLLNFKPKSNAWKTNKKRCNDLMISLCWPKFCFIQRRKGKWIILIKKLFSKLWTQRVFENLFSFQGIL